MARPLATTELTAAAAARGKWFWIVPLLCVLLTLAACGISASRSSEGFADLGSLRAFDVKRTMGLSFGPAVLHFAARYIDGDPETARFSDVMLAPEIDAAKIPRLVN